MYNIRFLWLIVKTFWIQWISSRSIALVKLWNLTFLGFDCSHFNQSLSWLTFLLGLKKRKKEEGKKEAGSCLRFRLPLSFRKQSGGAVEAPESPQLRYITGPMTVQRSHRYTVCQKHLHKQQPPKREAAEAFERELKHSPPKKAPPKSTAKSLSRFSHWQTKPCLI